MSSFAKSGINCLSKVESKKAAKRLIDVLGAFGNVILLVECVGTDGPGGKIKKAITDFKKIREKFSEIVASVLAQTPYKQFFDRNKPAFYSGQTVFKRLVVSLGIKTSEQVEKTHSEMCREEEINFWTREEAIYFDIVASSRLASPERSSRPLSL